MVKASAIQPSFSTVNPSGFYVYIHIRALDGKPFYVGKGSRQRGWHSSPKNRIAWWIRTASKYGVRIEIAQDNMSEDDAFLLEMWLIAKLRHEGVALVNNSNGGSGVTTGGHKISTKYAISFAHGGRPVYCSNGMIFDLPALARDWLRHIGNEKAQSCGITSCCRGITHTYLGYAWSYDGKPDEPKGSAYERMALTVSRPIISSDGQVYISVADAVRKRKSAGLRASVNGIRSCLDEPNKSAYGMTWRSV